MKAFALWTLCLFIFVSYGQNDTILPNQNGEYEMELMTIDPISFDFVFTSEHISIVDDTPGDDTLSVIHNSDTIAHLALNGDQVFIKRSANPYSTYYIWDGFATDFGTGYELLYDFSLIIGDTAWYQYGITQPVIVTSIDMINVQGQLRKKLNMDTGESWIQGMGSTYHPLAPKLFYFENAYQVCTAYMHYSGASAVGTASYIGPCGIPSSANTLEVSPNLISVYPNPTTNDLNLNVDETVGVTSVLLFDKLGRQIMNLDVNSTKTKLYLTNLNPGIYFYRIALDDGSNLVGKITKE